MHASFPIIRHSICLAQSLGERTERDVYVASAWHRHVDFTERPHPRKWR